MPGRWSWVALGVSAYVAFAAALLPAGVVVQAVAPPDVVVAGLQGTVWSGSAASLTAQGLTVRDVRWTLQPAQLLLGRVAASLEARLSDGFLSTDVVVTASTVRFVNLRGGVSLPSLSKVLPVRGMRGQASVVLESLELDGNWPTHVVGELRLAGLEVTPFVPSGSRRLIALGDYTVSFTDAAPRELAATFVDNGGPLEVSGTVTVDGARAYVLDALIEARASADAELVQGLAITTAEPDAEGRRRLTLTGSL